MFAIASDSLSSLIVKLFSERGECPLCQWMMIAFEQMRNVLYKEPIVSFWKNVIFEENKILCDVVH